MLSFNQAQLARLAGLDLTRKRERKKRQICRTFELQMMAANALYTLGVAVNAATIRRVFDELGILTEQGGNQSIGDTLGQCGLDLPTYKQGGEKCYRVPEGGITKEMAAKAFVVPPGYRWSDEGEVAEPAAVVAPVIEQPVSAGPPVAVAEPPLAAGPPTAVVAEPPARDTRDQDVSDLIESLLNSQD